MQRSVSLAIPNDRSFLPLAIKVVEETAHLAGLEGAEVHDLLHAVRELLSNAIEHAYPPGEAGIVDLDLRLQPHGIQVSIHDMGLPFNYEQYLRSEREGGLRRIPRYVDELRFANLGKEGKAFTIFKAHPLNFVDERLHPYSDLEDNSPASLKPASIQIRDFLPGDGEAIARLIYSNYSYSYFKAIFYYPNKIRQMNEQGEIASVVAQTREGKIVGHFSLIRVPRSRIAEVGVAVVHPDYKGKGIMNAMLDRIINRAREMKLSAVFGEALMVHPYSQRANLRHGFAESALVLGLVPSTMSLTDPNAVQSSRRGAVLIGFKILAGARRRRVHLPRVYGDLLRQIYAANGLEILPVESVPEREERADVSHESSPFNQTGTLLIRSGGADLLHQIRHHLHRLYRKHADMIYADLNLMRCNGIDEVVAQLKEEGFVFGGVLFYRQEDEDYLRMQMINCDHVETDHLVCHSSFCKELLGEIRREIAQE